MKRTLSLSRETLAELTDEDLAGVVGAAAITVQGATCPLLNSCINFSTPPRCE
jgi:hypothetical protein